MNLKESIQSWLDTWAPHCGAPRKVFEGQFKTILIEIFDEIEKGKSVDQYYDSLREVRKQLVCPRTVKTNH